MKTVIEESKEWVAGIVKLRRGEIDEIEVATAIEGPYSSRAIRQRLGHIFDISGDDQTLIIRRKEEYDGKD